MGWQGHQRLSLFPVLTPVSWYSPHAPTSGLGCQTTRTPPALGSASIQGQVQSDQGETEEREPAAGSPEVGADIPEMGTHNPKVDVGSPKVGTGQNTMSFLWLYLLFRRNSKRSQSALGKILPDLSLHQNTWDRDWRKKTVLSPACNQWPRALHLSSIGHVDSCASPHITLCSALDLAFCSSSWIHRAMKIQEQGLYLFIDIDWAQGLGFENNST